jgi:hypothetical protein
VRLHIITGDAEKAKNEAYELQRAERDMDWMVLDSSTPSSLLTYTQKRNVIWVFSGSGPISPTSKHHVMLPTTFGSSVIARVVVGGVVSRFVLSLDDDGDLSWLDKSGSAYRGDDLIEPVISFVAEEV